MERKEAELRMLRKRLHDTRCRLGEVRDENARLRDELGLLHRENAMLKRDPATPARALAHARELAEAAYADCPERRAALERLEECAMWMGRSTPGETAAPAHGEAAAGAAQQAYVDVRPALDEALASWDPMEDVRRLMLRSAVD
nr:MAG TPA_asm: hypothetical protein [Caudoviricetes sp.]